MRHVLWLLVVLVCAVPPNLARSEEATRIFLRLSGERKEMKALDGARLRFESVTLRDGKIALAGTAEMDEVFAECRTEMGVSATEERQCRLQAARRIFVEQVVEIELSKVSRKQYELALTVWDPDSNAKVFADLLEVEADDADDAARDGLAKLAEAYICWHHGPDGCVSQAAHIGAQGSNGNANQNTNQNTPDPNDVPRRGPLTSDEIKQAFAARHAELRACAHDTPGALEIAFVIGRNGRVREVEGVGGELMNTAEASCLLRIVEDIRFRATGKQLSITFPLAFR